MKMNQSEYLALRGFACLCEALVLLESVPRQRLKDAASLPCAITVEWRVKQSLFRHYGDELKALVMEVMESNPGILEDAKSEEMERTGYEGLYWGAVETIVFPHGRE